MYISKEGGGGGVTTKAIRLLCIANASEMAKWNSLCSDSVISTVFVNAVTQIKNTNDFIPISYTEHLINIPVRYLILAKKYCFIFFAQYELKNAYLTIAST